MATRVNDDEIHAQLSGGDKLMREGPYRALAQIRVWGGEVDQVLRVGDDGEKSELAAAFDECFGVRTRRGHGPALRVGDEDLSRLAA